MTFTQLLLIGFPLLCALMAAAAIAHAILTKRDVRAAIGWVVVAIASPFFGPVAYWLLGVNRINRRAAAIFGERDQDSAVPRLPRHVSPEACFGALGLRRFIDGLVPRPKLDGNHVEPLESGREAYGAMIEAIEHAERSVTMATYIFDTGDVGSEFADALAAAVARGVECRVLIDGIGQRYSERSMVEVLASRDVVTRAFLPARHPLRAPYFNLRNHRKVMVVDGRTAFTGGMNVRDGHRDTEGPHQIRDIHFRVTGPVVAQLQSVFAEDWMFASKERLQSDLWFPVLEETGDMQARAISDGPDHDLDKIYWTLLAGLACARHRVQFSTPYFLPINGIDRAIEAAARRGVHVDIFLPEHNNLRLVQWASRNFWPRIVDGGARLWLVGGPFDHSKIMLVDSDWSFIGSSNWDPRSLRLNFELNVEVGSAQLNQQLENVLAAKRMRSRAVQSTELDQRPLPERLLEGTASLFAPYL